MEFGAIRRDLRTTGLRGEIVGPDDPAFDQRRRVWNGVADRRPTAIVRAVDVRDVSSVVRFAADHGMLLAVRGGGHSLPGLSTCDDGIVLDLSGINSARVDVGAREVVVGGGCRLGDMDRATVAYGLVTPAGVVSHTGVGGLTLGGGMGWLSRRLGLTIDSLVGVELVQADGQISDVDAEHDPELFWGLRGGGGNFGVVTAFRFRLHELGHVLIGEWTYAPAAARAVLDRYADLTSAAPRALTTAFVLAEGALTITAVWSGGATEALGAIEGYGGLGSPLTTSIGGRTFLEHQSRGDEHLRWGRRVYAKGGFLAELDENVIDLIDAAVTVAPGPDAEVYVLRLGGAIQDIDETATAYAGRAAEHYWIVEPVWDDPKDDEACFGWGRSFGRAMAERSMTGNYVNEQADADPSVARQSYGGDTYRRLAALKARVDPGNLFRLNQNIEPGH